MALYSDTISWFRAHQLFALTPYLVPAVTHSVLNDEAANTIFLVFSLTWSCLEPMVYHFQGQQANHYTINAVHVHIYLVAILTAL
jgi:hypothetical protein